MDTDSRHNLLVDELTYLEDQVRRSLDTPWGKETFPTDLEKDEYVARTVAQLKIRHEIMARVAGRDVRGVDVRHMSLEDWLHTIKHLPKDAHVENYRFPSDEVRDAYLEQVGTRSQREVNWLLSRFLSVEGPFPRDEEIATYVWVKSKGGERQLDVTTLSYADRRALQSFRSNGRPPRDSIKWILDLIDYSPLDALRALDAYFLCHWQRLPDGRIDGLLDAMDIIRACFIQAAVSDDVLDDVSSRDFEFLVAALYSKMGFSVEVTKATRDKGRDIIATKQDKGSKSTILINATRSAKQIGESQLVTMRGVVERFGANLGVIVSTSTVSSEAARLANTDPRLDAIDRQRFIEFMNTNFGPRWSGRLDRIITLSKALNGK